MSNSIIHGGNYPTTKTVGSPRDEYRSVQSEWEKNRAVIQGQTYVKDYDANPSVKNILLPFNSTMTQEQYDHYKAEAELPGVSSQYARMLTGGLLRKIPQIEIRDNRINQEEAIDWLQNRFGRSNESLISFLDTALWEEMQTSRAWIQIDYPNVDLQSLTPEQREQVCPFPRLWTAESIINWSTDVNPITGEERLDSVIVRSYSKDYSDNTYHAQLRETVWVHRLDEDGLYVIDTYVNNNSTSNSADPTYIDGQLKQPNHAGETESWVLVNSNTNIFAHGERLNAIPFLPLNGSIDIIDPTFSQIVDREVALYNKISRRNHLLYLSATYTPVVKSDNLSDQDKAQLAKQGLGTWMFIGGQDSIDTLSTPTDALKDMEAAITSGYDEMTRIGVKMLSLEPNNSDVSGTALQIRNAAQNAQIATLNAKISEQMRKVIHWMLYWKYGVFLNDSDLVFNLSSDFNKLQTSTETIRLISEWYQSGIIPRSLFVEIMKNNDILPNQYNDDKAVNEIEEDDLVMSPAQAQAAEVESVQADNMEERLSNLENNNQSNDSNESEENN
ncbi:MAG: DUF4055 domain-containing protein [Bdellovibrionales bacterium]